MSKWETLLAGVTSTPETPKEILTADFGFLQFAMLAIFLVVLVVFVVASNKSSNASRVNTITEEVGTVVRAVVAEEKVVETEKPNLVKVKFSGKQIFSEANPEDFEDSAYGEFARTLDGGREMPDLERPISHNTFLMNDQLAPMREALKKSGKSLSQFMTETDAYVPDALIDAWDAPVETFSPTRVTQILDDEERIIARDAFQVIPIKATSEEALLILRDVLAARTESAHRSIVLPEMPQDQMASIKHWASQQGPAAKIAISILERI